MLEKRINLLKDEHRENVKGIFESLSENQRFKISNILAMMNCDGSYYIITVPSKAAIVCGKHHETKEFTKGGIKYVLISVDKFVENLAKFKITYLRIAFEMVPDCTVFSGYYMVLAKFIKRAKVCNPYNNTFAYSVMEAVEGKDEYNDKDFMLIDSIKSYLDNATFLFNRNKTDKIDDTTIKEVFDRVKELEIPDIATSELNVLELKASALEMLYSMILTEGDEQHGKDDKDKQDEQYKQDINEWLFYRG